MQLLGTHHVRPSEILGLRIRDVIFKTNGTNQYAEIVVNGKTGNRSIPLFSADICQGLD